MTRFLKCLLCVHEYILVARFFLSDGRVAEEFMCPKCGKGEYKIREGNTQ